MMSIDYAVTWENQLDQIRCGDPAIPRSCCHVGLNQHHRSWKRSRRSSGCSNFIHIRSIPEYISGVEDDSRDNCIYQAKWRPMVQGLVHIHNMQALPSDHSNDESTRQIYFNDLITASAYSNVLDLPPRSPVMVCHMSAS